MVGQAFFSPLHQSLYAPQSRIQNLVKIWFDRASNLCTIENGSGRKRQIMTQQWNPACYPLSNREHLVGMLSLAVLIHVHVCWFMYNSTSSIASLGGNVPRSFCAWHIIWPYTSSSWSSAHDPIGNSMTEHSWMECLFRRRVSVHIFATTLYLPCYIGWKYTLQSILTAAWNNGRKKPCPPSWALVGMVGSLTDNQVCK